MTRHPILLIVSLVAWSTACSPEPRRQPDPQSPAGSAPAAAGAPKATLSPADLKAALPRKGFLLIRLENPNPAQIPGTDASFAFDDLKGLEGFIGADRHRPVVLYCRTAPKARQAAAALRAAGYDAVSILEGGITAWQAEAPAQR